MADDKPSLIKLGPKAKLTNATITDNTVVGDANLINNQGAIENSKIERNELLQYPGGPTWVDKEYDPHFAEPEKKERFSVLRSIWAWLKDKVLGGNNCWYRRWPRYLLHDQGANECTGDYEATGCRSARCQ